LPALRVSSRLACVCLAGLVGVSAGSAQAAAAPRDPFFPQSGNRGYDVAHYDVRFSYRPHGAKLHGKATIEATAQQSLGRLSFDLAGMKVTGVTVNGEQAGFSRGDDKLRIVPAAPLPAGQPFAAIVDYRGTPRTITDSAGPTEGWIRTGDGAIGIGEPVGTPVWMPCNDTLADKASFSFQITVPERLKGVANGRLLSVSHDRSHRTFEWSEAQPMAPYLAAIDIGRGKLARSEIAGIPAWTMVDPRLARTAKVALRPLPEIVRFLDGLFGPYPFDALGASVDLTERFALEAQTRPIFGLVPHQGVLVHEIAHQWFGDSVGLRRWPDIWLNEGFATWTQWYYAERHGGASVRQLFRLVNHEPASEEALWEPPPGHPGGPEELFADSVYVRGAMTLEALRIRIGTAKLLEVLRRWATEHRYGNAGTNQFIALAEEVSGQRLGPLFDRWLYKPGKP
jgi:aminopeptidase N